MMYSDLCRYLHSNLPFSSNNTNVIIINKFTFLPYLPNLPYLEDHSPNVVIKHLIKFKLIDSGIGDYRYCAHACYIFVDMNEKSRIGPFF